MLVPEGPQLVNLSVSVVLHLFFVFVADAIVAASDVLLRGMQFHANHLNVVSLYKPGCNL